MVNKFTLLDIYLNNPKKTYILSDFEKHFKIPHQTIKKYLDVLSNDGVIDFEKRGRNTFYNLNMNSIFVYDYLCIAEKIKTMNFLKKKTEIRIIYEDLIQYITNNRIILFGSSTESDKYNDIDIINLDADKNIDKKVYDFEFSTKSKIHYLSINSKNISKLLKEQIIKKHVILNNHDYWVKFLFG